MFLPMVLCCKCFTCVGAPPSFMIQEYKVRMMNFSKHNQLLRPLFLQFKLLICMSWIFMYSYLNHKLPNYFNSYFTLNKEMHNRCMHLASSIHIDYTRANSLQAAGSIFGGLGRSTSRSLHISEGQGAKSIVLNQGLYYIKRPGAYLKAVNNVRFIEQSFIFDTIQFILSGHPT